MARGVLPLMRPGQNHDAIYIFRMRRAWRPLFALLCLVAGMSAGVHSQLSLLSYATGQRWGEPGIPSPALEVTFMLPDTGAASVAGASGKDVPAAQHGAGGYDNIQELLRASRARADECESRAVSFIWPVDGKVTDAFGWRIHPITGKRQFHNGIDIAAPSGTPVKSVASGTVELTGWSEGYGRIVIISHGEGYQTKYGHLSRYVVSTGQKVSRGESIGYVGESGNATGPHCHFEVEAGGQAVNPKDYLP